MTHPLKSRCISHNCLSINRHHEVVNGAGVGDKHGEIASLSGGSTEAQVKGVVKHVARIRVAGTLVYISLAAAETDELVGAPRGRVFITFSTGENVSVDWFLAVTRTRG